MSFIEKSLSALEDKIEQDQCDCYSGVKGAHRLARMVGYEIGAYTDSEINEVMFELYGRFLVNKNAGDVPIDDKMWDSSVRHGIRRFRWWMKIGDSISEDVLPNNAFDKELTNINRSEASHYRDVLSWVKTALESELFSDASIIEEIDKSLKHERVVFVNRR